MKKGLIFLFTILYNISLAHALDVNDYSQLQNAFLTSSTQNNPINITSKIDFTNQLNINNNTYINGNNNIIDGQNLYSGLEINAQTTISNLHLQNFIAADYGGAIKNNSTLYIHDSVFTNNQIDGTANYIFGGAIDNYGELHIYNTHFTSNKATGLEFVAAAAISSAGVLNVYNSFFTNNAVFSTTQEPYGAAIESYDLLNVYNTIFDNNTITATTKNSFGGAVFNEDQANIYNSTFTNNQAIATGASYGGAIYNFKELNVYNSHFENNQARYGGAIMNGALVGITANIYNSTFINNTAYQENKISNGGAISNTTGATMNIYNSTFINNTAATNGGAIRNSGNLNIYAIDGNTTFSGNTANGQSNALTNESITNLLASNGSIIFNDSISGTGTLTIGDNTHNGTIVLNNNMNTYTGDTTFNNGTIKIGSDMEITSGYTNFFAGNFTINGGTLDSTNNQIDVFNTTSWTTNSTLNAIIDVDMTTLNADYFANTTSHAINISGINIINYTNQQIFEVSVANTNNSLTIDPNIGTISSPIFEYKVDASNLNTSGKLSFTEVGYSPSVLTSSASNQAYSSILTSISKRILNSKKLFISSGMSSGDFTNNSTSPWIDIYASSEDIHLNNITIDAQTYVAVAGVDINGENIKDFKTTYSIYAGYVGSSQENKDISIDHNGLILGGGINLTKGYISSAFSANIGTTFADATNAFGTEDFNIYSLSISSKTGIKLNMYCEKYFLQPAILLGYNYLYTPKYTNSANVDIKSDGLHIFQVAPEIKFIAQIDDEHSAYIELAHNFNFDAGGDVTANNIILPTLTVKNYTQYSIGIRKAVNDEISGYAEIQATTGDRQGYGAQLGLKWHF